MIISYVIKYDHESAPDLAEIKSRVEKVQQLFPLLQARIVDGHTTQPAFELRDPWHPSEIVRERTLSETEDDGDDAALIQCQLQRSQRVDYYTRPAWSVDLIHGAKTSFLGLNTNHVIMDGRGSLRLLAALTQPDGMEGLSTETLGASLYDNTVDIKPTLKTMIPVFWQEIIVPILPVWLQQRVISSTWPGAQPTPLNRDFDVALASLSASTTALLKATAKARGVPTLHPVLQTAYVAASWAVFHKDADELTFVTSAPRSERTPTLGHSAVTSVYVNVLEDKGIARGSHNFWDEAQRLSAHLTDPSTIDTCRRTIGLLAWMPDPTPGKDGITGWDRYFTMRATAAAPFFDSLMVSNLGAMSLPPGATDSLWSQINHPCTLALCGSLFGHNGGLRLTTTFFEGVPATKAEVDRVHRLWEGILTQVATGAGGTFADLAQAVEAE
ncbi:uncharacterized protein EHS24_001872 [Apiotrichum porosum]|uniref:Uncharacterized protein n=1 Tax=Apiotrichum porosum TaxID=105984 RepID=A0A427XJ75_9TREE|nr:uncharacterized protein EHS24_001872 [Apiotrichum porosum]RSH78949.1 hypothetical protein EHS24_001872 [Apiotrichum porosum]